jgi:hypothetical protein
MKMHETQGRKQDTHHIDTAAGFFGTCGRREMQNPLSYYRPVFATGVQQCSCYTYSTFATPMICL